MSIPKPAFNNVLSHYPLSSSDFGAGGTIINNPAYEHSCALRMSVALDSACPGMLGSFTGNRAVHLSGRPGRYQRRTFPYARGALALARYLSGTHVSWTFRRLGSRRDAVRLTTPGIIFWKVLAGSGSPNHIDLWDPSARTLRNVGRRTMLWAPTEDIVDFVWYWQLKRGGAISPHSAGHSLQSGR